MDRGTLYRKCVEEGRGTGRGESEQASSAQQKIAGMKEELQQVMEQAKSPDHVKYTTNYELLNQLEDKPGYYAHGIPKGPLKDLFSSICYPDCSFLEERVIPHSNLTIQDAKIIDETGEMSFYHRVRLLGQEYVGACAYRKIPKGFSYKKAKEKLVEDMIYSEAEQERMEALSLYIDEKHYENAFTKLMETFRQELQERKPGVQVFLEKIDD